MYAHRGAYLNALGEIIHQRLDPESVYLWTLPMFHCNGWCTPWAVTAIGATHVCLRAVRADVIWQLLDDERVTHLDGAPTVLTLIADAPQAHPLGRELVATVAGAPPSPTVITRMRELGARIVHVYGMTEAYGPYALNEWQAGWSTLPPADQARRQARQGVAMIQADPIRVVDEKMDDVPRDGRTMGEIVMRGNNVMAGYFDDAEATETGVPRRLAALRRPRRAALRRLRRAARPGQGHHHLRRREHLDRRDRARHRDAPRGARGRRHRRSGREVGRAAQGLRHPQAGRRGQRGRADRLPADPHRPLQGAEGRSSSSTSSRARPPGRPRSSSSARRNGPATPAGSRDEGHDMLADQTYDEDVLDHHRDRQVAGHRLLRPARRADRCRAGATCSAPGPSSTPRCCPVINDYWERAEFPWALIKKMGALGIVGDGIEGYGCPPMSPVAAGLIHMELNRGDGSLGTFQAVQAGLAMRSIWMLGSEEQKQRWLPGMARLDKLGAFALTEPEHGSDAVALETTARRDGDGYVLNGEKRWIGNGTIADVIVVWARDTTDGQVKGFLVEKGAPGYDARVIEGKGSVRAVLAGRHHAHRRPGARRQRAARRAHASRTPPGCSPRPGSPSPGGRSATRWRPTRPR